MNRTPSGADEVKFYRPSRGGDTALSLDVEPERRTSDGHTVVAITHRDTCTMNIEPPESYHLITPAIPPGLGPISIGSIV